MRPTISPGPLGQLSFDDSELRSSVPSQRTLPTVAGFAGLAPLAALPSSSTSSRVFARLLDLLAAAPLWTPLFLLLPLPPVWAFLAASLVSLLLLEVLPVGLRGRSLGKALLGLQVAPRSEVLPVRNAPLGLLRTLLRVLAGVVCTPWMLVMLLLPASVRSPVHDRLAGTEVVSV